MSSSFGLFLSTIFSDAGVVMALVPVLIIPFLLVGGFFVPLSTVPKVYYPFEYLSMFRYGFEGMIYSQYENNPLVAPDQPQGVDLFNSFQGQPPRYSFEVILLDNLDFIRSCSHPHGCYWLCYQNWSSHCHVLHQ